MKAAIFVLVALCSLGLTFGVSCDTLYRTWADAHYNGVHSANNQGTLGSSHFLTIFDTDGDGVISKDEFNARLNALSIPADAAVKQAAAALWDANGDGTVTVDEATAFLGGSDANGDGSVTEDEAVPYWANFFKSIAEAAGVNPANCQ